MTMTIIIVFNIKLHNKMFVHCPSVGDIVLLANSSFFFVCSKLQPE